MSESRKNHLSIDGGQVKEDDHVSSYKPIPETDTEFRSSKTSLAKSKEKLSPDGAEEKLLPKEQEAKIVTRVDMADAKYVVEDHRNGDAKIELDANKKQFSGLTKEELMKYADDPFWVKLRWFMFILFWALWLCMLAGAIAIIVRAPKCAAPAPKAWYEKGPLVDMEQASYTDIEAELPHLQSKAQALFVDVPAYEQDTNAVEQFKAFVKKAKDLGIKVIVDLIPNSVSVDHPWFKLSVNKTAPYDKYFTWVTPKTDSEGNAVKPNQWVSVYNKSAWSLDAVRNEYFLHQFEDTQADLDFNNQNVVQLFNEELKKWVKAGADGVRLNNARQMVVDPSLVEEQPDSRVRGAVKGVDHGQYLYWRHTATSDQPALDTLLSTFSQTVAEASSGQDTVFTLHERSAPEYYRAHNTPLRPLLAAPLTVSGNVTALAHSINEIIQYNHTNSKQWKGIQLISASPEEAAELAVLQLLLPAAPVLSPDQLAKEDDNITESESIKHVVNLRSDASVEHGEYVLTALPELNSTDYTVLACARWKAGHAGYVALYNAGSSPARVNLSVLSTVPDVVSVFHISQRTKLLTQYSKNEELQANDVEVPAKSAIILYYVPKTSVEK